MDLVDRIDFLCFSQLDLDGDHLSHLALFDTHVFLMNEYFMDLNTANFKKKKMLN